MPKGQTIEDILTAEGFDDETINRIITRLIDTVHIDTLTDLSQNQITAINRGEWFAKMYQVKPLQEFIRGLKIHLISKDRKGRQELIQALVGAIIARKTTEKSTEVRI